MCGRRWHWESTSSGSSRWRRRSAGKRRACGPTDLPGGVLLTPSPYLGSWADYVASTSGSATAANSLGAFGVDTTTNTVWAAINHNSQFAVTGAIIVPEPGALALAGIGIAAAAYAYRRRRA